MCKRQSLKVSERYVIRIFHKKMMFALVLDFLGGCLTQLMFVLISFSVCYTVYLALEFTKSGGPSRLLQQFMHNIYFLFITTIYYYCLYPV